MTVELKKEWFNEPDDKNLDYSFEECDFLAALGLSVRKNLVQETFEIFHWPSKKMIFTGTFNEVSRIVRNWNILMFKIYIALQNGPMTRPELVNLLEVPRSTIFDNLTKLILRKRVFSFRAPEIVRGRPRIYFTVEKPVITVVELIVEDTPEEDGITAQQQTIIDSIEENGPLSIGDLAEIFELKKEHLWKPANQLVQRNILKRIRMKVKRGVGRKVIFYELVE